MRSDNPDQNDAAANTNEQLPEGGSSGGGNEGLIRALDTLGDAYRAETPAGLVSRVEAVVQDELDLGAPLPLSLDTGARGRWSALRIGGVLAAAAAVVLVATVAFNPQTGPAVPGSPLASGSDDVQSTDDVDVPEELLTSDLGDWLASMSVDSGDDAFDGIMSGTRTDGSEAGFWNVDSILSGDTTSF